MIARVLMWPPQWSLLHQRQIPCALDLPGDVPLLNGGEPGDPARQDLACIGDIARQDLDVQGGHIHGTPGLLDVFCVFLGHKRAKATIWRAHDKQKEKFVREGGVLCCFLALGLKWVMLLSFMHELRQLPRATLAAGAFLLLLVVLLILDQRHWWDLRDDYLFGYLVPLFVAWVLYERWPLIRLSLIGGAVPQNRKDVWEWQQHLVRRRVGPPPGGAIAIGLTAVAGCAAVTGFLGVVFAALYRSMEGPNLVTTQLLALSFMVLLLSGSYLFSDERSDGAKVPVKERLAVVGLLVFPACIWLLSAPMFNFIEKGISTFLLSQVATAVFLVFDLLGFSILQEGNILVLPQGEVGVEDACSGIRSLMACLFAGSFLAAACLPPGLKSLWKKVCLVAASMLFAFIMNIGRSLFLTAWAYAHGPEAIGESVHFFGIDLGTVHDVTGFAVIAPVVGALLLLLPLFTLELERPDSYSEDSSAPA